MAAGCPVVAHAVGGVEEIVGGGTAGVVVASLDPAAWEADVRALLTDPERRARLVEAGRRVARERTIDRTVACVEAELLRALGDAA
jgi:glycosyltransferase involved in cell wall biosynthesis